jgi:hypothetical protein
MGKEARAGRWIWHGPFGEIGSSLTGIGITPTKIMAYLKIGMS